MIADADSGAPREAVIDRITMMEGLNLGNGVEPALVIDVIDVFLRDAPALVHSIREAITSSDEKGMLRSIHMLKSSAAVVAAPALVRAAAAAEAQARDGRTQEILARLPELVALVDAAARELAVIQADLRRSKNFV